MKLENLVAGKDLIITQSAHGAAQNSMAFDFGHLSGQAQAPGKVSKVTTLTDSKLDPRYPKRQSYFHYLFDGSSAYTEMVHAEPTKSNNSRFRTYEPMWRSLWHHVHVALVNHLTKWDWLLPYMRRDIALWWLKIGQKHPVWTNWSTYHDLHLPPFPIIIKEEMVALQQKIKCKVISTIKLNVRETPNTAAKIIAQVEPATIFETNVVATGTSVEGVATWYKYGNGYISGKYVQELQSTDTTGLQKELAAEKLKTEKLTEQNNTLVSENTALVAKNIEYQSAYDAAKLIQNVK